MAENLVSRVKRIVAGGVNNIVDAVENASPEMVMKEAIREVEGAIDQVHHELGEVIASKHLASQKLMDANTKHEEISTKIRIAISEKRDDLAEAAIARQLDIESQIPILESAIKDASAQETELESYIAALQARKREMDDDLSVFLKTQKANQSNSAPFGEVRSSDAEAKTSKAESAFNRVMSTSTGLPGMNPTDRQSSAKLAELEKLARDNRVHERLAAFKANGSAESQ